MATLFGRIVVADVEQYKVVHARAEQPHRKYGITESVYQDAADPRSLTIVIKGEVNGIESWMKSPERAELAASLKVESAGERWMTDEMFPEGVYRTT